MLITSVSLIGTIVFLIGFFFVAKSEGQGDCTEEPSTLFNNKVGGGFGIAIGGLILLVASILSIKSQSAQNFM